MQVGKTKDQGLYNKPSAAVHPGALAAGTLPQYNTILLEGKSFAMELGNSYFDIKISPNSCNDFRVFSNCVCFISMLEPANNRIKNLFGFWRYT